MNDATPTPGSRLKAEREQRGLSAQKAGDEMHLDAWVIDALEAGDYARIGPTVYAKGHLRKYAAMLGLPVAEIMSDFEPQQPAAPSRDVSSIPVGSRHGTPPSRVVSPGQAAASLAGVFALIGVMWWQPWQHRNRTQAGAPAASAVAEVREPGTAADVDASDGPAGAPLSAQDYAPGAAAPGAAAPRPLAATGTGGGVLGKVIGTTVAGMPATGSAAAGTPAAGMPSTRTMAANAPVVAAPAAGTAGAGRARLRLSFSSDSWVDVRDALGNRTYAGNGSANTVKTIAGNAPLHVYLRSANGVQLEINGRAVAIAPQFFSGDVARFEAGADGVLRRDASRDTTRPEQTPARPPG
jgi:cytoskeleton protein RodZ